MPFSWFALCERGASTMTAKEEGPKHSDRDLRLGGHLQSNDVEQIHLLPTSAKPRLPLVRACCAWHPPSRDLFPSLGPQLA